ncbi:DUF2344 domain-containing protein [bacterium]|nr:DUF2344 domain-containing protein [bacterium]
MSFQRVLLRFSKKGETRFLSHHDLMRLFERAVRRAELPVRMTEGFNPHPKLAILLALPLGAEADEEPLEVELEEPILPSDVGARLDAQLPRGIRIVGAEALGDRQKARPDTMVYRIELPECDTDLQAQTAAFLAKESVVVTRETPKRRRTIDLRPAVQGIAVEGTALTVELAVAQSGTPKPTEVVEAVLGRAAGSTMRLRRTRVQLCLVGPPGPGAAQE